MSESRREIQVGAALVAALVLLVFGLMWFEDYQLAADYQPVMVRYSTVGGLGSGDPVNVRGIKVGQVRHIELEPSSVLVELRLRRDVVLHEDAVLKIASAGIMGERMVSVEPGSGAAIGEGHVFDGQYEMASTDLIGQLEGFNATVISFVEHADSMLMDLRQDDALVRAVSGAAEATESLNELLKENRSDLREIASNTADLTARLGRFLEEHEKDLSQGAAGMARATTTLDTLSRQLGGVLTDTQKVLTALTEQKGPAGRMIFDEEAGENLVQALEQLRFLVEDLQRNPERYLTVKIF
ncbi:hypothetical protein DRQ32_00215 [bacterium]|nr:MAG: hypothetical protein DRQ32_00215 [bacterium]